MGGSQSSIPNRQSVPRSAQEEANTYEDEIDLMDYFRVLWKRKYFILLGSVLPALLVCLILFFSPRDYRVTYTYDIEMDEKAYEVLLDRFYSAENLDRLISKLRESGLIKYAQKIAGATTDKTLRKVVSFELLPSDFRRDTGRISVILTDIEDLERIQPARDRLLTMTILGRQHSSTESMVSIVRDNFEKVIPMYSVKEELNTAIINFKANMANVEENTVSLKLELERKTAISAKLKNLESEGSNEIPANIVLQFDSIRENSEYLPLAYQIQATDANIIDLEESIRANQKMYGYYEGLLRLNERLFDQVRGRISSYYTIQEFHSFLANTVSDYEEKELIDYLNAYIKKIESAISTNIPVVEKPKVYLISKGTVKKTMIVFAALLMITTFAAFLLEGIKKSQAQAS